ncbi:metallophosphoesterase family protein [Candidatus Kaiserbacteria bacterium]|nr:metallophosphoesterase family protein [Candidatus Kaiserbacteria bacterium]
MKADLYYIDISRSILPNCNKAVALVLGDLHMGSDSFRVRAATELIQYYVGKGLQKVILQGDTFEHNNLKKLPKEHGKFLKLLKQIDLEMVWLPGNHDTKLPELLARFYDEDVMVSNECEFMHDDKLFGVIHGDSFDPVMQKNGWRGVVWGELVEIGTAIHNFVQSFDSRFDSQVAPWLKSLFKKELLKTVKHVRKGATKHAKHNGLDVVVCGHTHETPKIISAADNDNITYINVGCFTEEECGALLITDENYEIVRLITRHKPKVDKK